MTTNDPYHIFLKVELEIKVDGGGGEAGEEVEKIAHQWNWKHGRKVHKACHSGLLFNYNEMHNYQLRE